jgi:2-polyprenyl-3-methyl-5-hydroxy-6-metoxy-1,4-benzoquinol methylase
VGSTISRKEKVQMFNGNTDRDWERLGATDPYYGVLIDEKYRKGNLTPKAKEAFFKSGEQHIAKVMASICKHIDSTYAPRKALEFGCGVGRLVIPLAKLAEHVVGVDISESMINEAKRNCESLSIRNVTFVKSDDNLSQLNERYDLIHSYIVFQHLSVRRGEAIFKRLLQRLENGGVCVVHFTYAKRSKMKIAISWIKSYIPVAKNFINLIRGRPFFAPQRAMNSYDLNRLLFLMQQQQVRDFYAEYTDHGGELGILVYFRKLELT